MLTSGDQLIAILGQDEILDTLVDLAKLVVEASGDSSSDAAYVALVGLMRMMPLAWSDALSEHSWRMLQSHSAPELDWFRTHAAEQQVDRQSDCEIIKVASMLARDGVLDRLRGSL